MVLRCDNCDFPILGFPARVGERVYCCLDCARGGPCNCNYTVLRQQTAQIHWLLPGWHSQVHFRSITGNSGENRHEA